MDATQAVMDAVLGDDAAIPDFLQDEPAQAEPAPPMTDADFAKKLKAETIACRLHFTKFGSRKSLDKDQREKAADAFDADKDALSASKRLIDTKDVVYKDITTILNAASKLWRAITIPYPEPGIRLIRRDRIGMFDDEMKGMRADLKKKCKVLDEQYERLLEAARMALGKLFNPKDYPDTLIDAFDMSWDFPNIDPPNYLRDLNPELYRKEQERVAKRLEDAVELAEQSFVEEFKKLVGHLCGKLSGEDDGKKKMFKNTSVTNIQEFIGRFKQLNIGSNKELEALVGKCEKLMQGVDPKDVRGDKGLQDVIAGGLEKIGKDLDGMIVERPARKVMGFEE